MRRHNRGQTWQSLDIGSKGHVQYWVQYRLQQNNVRNNNNIQYTKVLHQITTNVYIHILLKHHFINTMHHSDMFQPSKGHSLRLLLIHISSIVNKMTHQMQNSN